MKKLLALLALCLFPVLALAQAAPINPQNVVFNLPSTATATLLSYLPDLLTVIAAVVAWWKHTQLKGARKIIGGIIEGVEVGTATDAGQAVEKSIKGAIKARVNQKDPSGALGKILASAVQEITPHVIAEMDSLAAAPTPETPAPTPAALPSNPAA